MSARHAFPIFRRKSGATRSRRTAPRRFCSQKRFTQPGKPRRRTSSMLRVSHYTASKAGLLGLTRAAAKELGKYGITVNAVCPGMIDTELTRENATTELLARLAAGYPVPRLGTALEVADLICFAASEAAGYVTGTALD